MSTQINKEAVVRLINMSGLTIYYFSKDKVIGHWQVVDRLGFLG